MSKRKTTDQSGPENGKPASTGADFGVRSTGEPTPYVVLARKYRPSTFDDLIGQEAMVTTLRNAFATGRLAQAYMLTGVRGVGKTTTARILARALNYEDDTVSAPTIDMPERGIHCTQIIESRHPDVIEMDAASNTGVDNIREVIEGARYRPGSARYKVYIIDEVHMLSKGAFNALLKTLEEPPEHVKFVFATTEVRKVPVTVLSRCQRFDLRRVEAPALVAHFRGIAEREGMDVEDEALAHIARASEGSVRDGLSILDQAFATASGKVSATNVRAMLGLADRGRILDLLESILSGAAAQALDQFAALHGDGADPVQVLGELAEAVHVITRIAVAGEASATDTLSKEERARASALAARISIPLLSRAWQMLLKGLDEVPRAPDARAAGEMVLIRMAHVAELPTPGDLARLLAEGNTSHNATLNGRPSDPRATSGTSATDDNRQGALAGHRDHAGQTGPRSGAHTAALRTATAAHANVVPFVAAQAVPEAGPAVQARPDPHLVPALEAFAEDDDDGEFELDAGDVAPVEAPVTPVLLVGSFEEVVQLAETQRDLKLKLDIEQFVRLVSFSTGRMEINLANGARNGFANELGRKLGNWTGQRWIVTLTREPGAPTIAEQKLAEIERLKATPMVRSALESFPGAMISAVMPLADGVDDIAGGGTGGATSNDNGEDRSD